MMLVSSPSLIAEGDPEAGKSKSAVCAACHGQDGNSINPDWPSLAGQHEKYLIQSMTAYKNQMRKNAIMYPLAMSLSDQDIEDLAAYYHSQKAA
ncbi:MAG: cytochrome c, partial [Pseudomonadota bacterium]|nr:cytochrome c [Pseudomonadota bacterium]